MHTLEDILQRLVPARDHDSFGGNPFLAVPVVHRPVVPPTAEDANEIVSVADPVLRATVGISRTGSISDSPRNERNQSSSGSNNWASDSSKENQVATTSIYVVGVVAVIPLAGLILWIVRVQLHKRREVIKEKKQKKIRFCFSSCVYANCFFVVVVVVVVVGGCRD